MPPNSPPPTPASVGVFATRYPQQVFSLANKPDWVALEMTGSGSIKDGKDPNLLPNLSSAGIGVKIWAAAADPSSPTYLQDQQALNQAAVDKAKSVGASEVIFLGEDNAQLQAAQTVAAGAGMATGIVGNPGLIPTGALAGSATTLYAETYQNANPYSTPATMLTSAQRTGAANINLTLGSYSEGNVSQSVPMSTYLTEAQAVGATNISAFSLESIVGNGADQQAFSDYLGHRPAGGPLPQLYNPSQKASQPFGGVGAFTASAPGYALPLAGSLDWVGVKVGGSDGLGGPAGPSTGDVANLQTAGLTTYFWAQPANPSDPNYLNQQIANDQAAISAAQQLGAVGVILPGKDQTSLQAALIAGGQTNLPKALLGDPSQLQPGALKGWAAVMPFADPSQAGGANLQTMITQAQQSGANLVAPVVGAYPGVGGSGLVADYLNQLRQAGVTNFGTFSLESIQTSGANLNSFLDYLGQRVTGRLPSGPAGVAGAGAPPVGANPTSPAAAHHPTHLSPAAGNVVDQIGQALGNLTTQPHHHASAVNNVVSQVGRDLAGAIGGPPSSAPAAPMTLADYQHLPAGAGEAPQAYTHANSAPPVYDPAKTYSFDDPAHHRAVTITTTQSGAKIEQVTDTKSGVTHPAYRIKPANATPPPSRLAGPNPNPTYGPVPTSAHHGGGSSGHNPPLNPPVGPPPTPTPSPPNSSNNPSPTRSLNAVGSAGSSRSGSTNTSTNINNSGIGPGSTSLALPPSPQPTAEHYDAGGLAAANPAHGAQAD